MSETRGNLRGPEGIELDQGNSQGDPGEHGGPWGNPAVTLGIVAGGARGHGGLWGDPGVTLRTLQDIGDPGNSLGALG